MINDAALAHRNYMMMMTYIVPAGVMQEERMDLPRLCITGFQQGICREYRASKLLIQAEIVQTIQMLAGRLRTQDTDRRTRESHAGKRNVDWWPPAQVRLLLDHLFRKVPDRASVQDSSSTPTLVRGSHPVASWPVLRDSCALMSCSAAYPHTCPSVGQQAIMPCHRT